MLESRVTACASLTLLLLLATQSNGYVYSNLSFSRPCPERFHDYHEPTGTFLCLIPTAEQCFNVCNQVGCYEWSYLLAISPYDTTPRDHYRCRCIKHLSTCLWSLTKKEHRGYEH